MPKNPQKDNPSPEKVKPTEKNRSGVLKYIVSAILIVAFISAFIGAGMLLKNEGYRNRHATALTVDGERITVAEYNYYFMSYVSTFVNNNASYLSSMGLDTSSPLKGQMMDETTTWLDYFHEQTKEYIRRVVVLANLAKENDLDLSDESKIWVSNYLADMETYAKSNGVEFEDYMEGNYGKGTNEKVIEKCMTRYYIGNEFQQSTGDGIEISDADIDSYYASNQDTFDYIDVRVFYFNAASGESADEEVSQEVMDKAKANAEEMLGRITDEASFNALAAEYATEASSSVDYSDPNATLQMGVNKKILGGDNEMTSWLFDENRKAGDKDVVEYMNGYYVFYMVSPPAREEYNTVSIRHILTKSNASDPATELTEEDQLNVKEEAENVLTLFEQGEKTEEAFGKLAEAYSHDMSTYRYGGLMENIQKGQLQTAIEEWAFDESRKPGDYTMLEVDGTYQLLYFTGEGEVCWKVQVENVMRSEKINKIVEDALSEKEIKIREKGMKRAEEFILEMV